MFCVASLFLDPLRRWSLSEGIPWPGRQSDVLSEVYDQDEVETIWQSLLARNPDPLLGYHAARFFQPSDWLSYTPRVFQCGSFEQLFKILLAAQGILAQPDFLRLEETEDRVGLWIEWRGFSGPVEQHLTEYCLRCLVLLGGWLRRPDQWIQELSLAHASRFAVSDRDYRLFRYAVGDQGRLRFNAERSGILVSRQVYEMPLRLAPESDTGSVRAHGGTAQADRWVQRSVLSIERHLRLGTLSRSQVALDLGVSERTLQRALEANGTTYAALVDAVRLRHARRLLAETDTPVLDIALEVGFRDPTNFFRLFKRKVGMTPTQYRTHWRTDPVAHGAQRP